MLFGGVFAYTPSQSDEALVNAFSSKIQSMSSEKQTKVVRVLEMLYAANKDQERYAYIFGGILNNVEIGLAQENDV